jgi:hypothetical protein
MFGPVERRCQESSATRRVFTGIAGKLTAKTSQPMIKKAEQRRDHADEQKAKITPRVKWTSGKAPDTAFPGLAFRSFCFASEPRQSGSAERPEG